MPSGAFGKADVFSLDSDSPTLTAQFDQGNAHQGEQFGTGVALSGSTMVVRTWSDAYVFERSAGVWAQQAQIFSGLLGKWGYAGLGRRYGCGELSSCRIKPNSVEILTRTNGTWTEQQTLSGSIQTTTTLEMRLPCRAMCSPWASGALAATIPPQVGSCHMFERAGTSWSEMRSCNPRRDNQAIISVSPCRFPMHRCSSARRDPMSISNRMRAPPMPSCVRREPGRNKRACWHRACCRRRIWTLGRDQGRYGGD